MHQAAGAGAYFVGITIALSAALGPSWAVQTAHAQSGPAYPFTQPRAAPVSQPTSVPRPLPPRGAAPGEAGPGAERGGGPSVWTTLGSLAVVLTLIFAGAKVWRKAVPAGGRALPAAALDVLGRRSLDNRHAITLVRCGSRVLVLGFSPQGMHTLAEVTDPVEVDFLSGLCRPSSESTPFAQAIWDVFRREPPTDPDQNANRHANHEGHHATDRPTTPTTSHREAYAPHA